MQDSTIRESEIQDEYLNLIGMSGKKYTQYELNCEVCDRHDFVKILDKGRIGKVGEYGPINIMQCNHCGHVMINPRYESQFYIDYYRDRYKDIGNFGGEKPKEGFLDRQIERGDWVRKFLSDEFDISSGSMLDLGCSYGAAMIPFQKSGWDVHGIDPEKSSIEYGKNDLNLPVVYGYGEDLPYEDESMDLVVSLGALEHVHDFHLSMMELQRVIKPGGHIFIRMRHNRPWGLMWEYYNKNHYRFFSEETHRLAVIRYGFDVLQYTDREIEGIPGHKYLVCKKMTTPSLERVEEAINEGIKDSPEKLTNYLSEHHSKFLQSARKIIDFAKEYNNDYLKIAKEIDEGRFEYTILDGDRSEAVERALFEAKRILEESGE